MHQHIRGAEAAVHLSRCFSCVINAATYCHLLIMLADMSIAWQHRGHVSKCWLLAYGNSRQKARHQRACCWLVAAMISAMGEVVLFVALAM